MLFLQLLWVFTFSTAKFAEFFCFFFGQGRILQRGHDHASLPMPVKGYGVRSTSCSNNNAGLQYFIVKGKLSVIAEFVVLLRDYAFSNNGVKMIVPMPDARLYNHLMHVVETTIQIYCNLKTVSDVLCG